MASSDSNTAQPPSPESAYHDLRRLIPSLASELDILRTSLREHNRWIQRYGHTASSSSGPSLTAPPPDPTPTTPATSSSSAELPAYSAPDVPPYTPGPQSTTQQVIEQRDQLTEYLREGEDVLREYSARFAQVGRELGMPYDDVLGTWIEGQGQEGDNALPDYTAVESREELMVGGVGEVPPPYVGGGKQPPAS